MTPDSLQKRIKHKSESKDKRKISVIPITISFTASNKLTMKISI